jgi:hypothetical protein
MATTTNSHISHLAQAPIEVAVRAALAAQGRHFDNEDVARATSFVMAGLTPAALQTIAASGTASSHLLQALIPQATAHITANTLPWNMHGAAIDPTRFGGGRTGTGSWLTGSVYLASSGGDGEDDRRSTSARFDRMSTAEAALVSEMRSYALGHHLGNIGWAADRPEILRLGRDAIDLLARTNFQRQSFDRLKEAGFEARDAVNIARHAERHGLDANELARRAAEAPRIFAGGNPEHEREWRERFQRFFRNPDDAQGRQDMDRRLTDIETRGTLEQRERAKQLRPLLKLEQETRVELNTTTAVAADRQRQDDSALADLNAVPTARPAVVEQRADVRQGATVNTAIATQSTQPPRLA